MPAQLISINVGLPQELVWQGRSVRTAILKTAVAGPRLVRRLNVDGDGQGDLSGHGGEHRAVFVYQLDSYRHWARELNRNDFVYGQFGENFTVEGLLDAEVCIGDRYRIGDALFEVTQPRVTCYRVGIRMNNPEMAELLVAHRRPGFYLRVLEEGLVEAGQAVVQVQAGPERMTISEIDALLYLPEKSRGQLERALRIPALSAGWRDSFETLLAKERGNGAEISTGHAQGWSGFRTVRVTGTTRESESVTSLNLDPVEGPAFVSARPGQFVVVRLEVAAGAPQQMRNYSLSGDPSARSYRISVKREAHGAVSVYINDKVQIGDVLAISAPRGNFTLPPGETPVVLLGAGIGATPLLAMLHALASQTPDREVFWIYGARNGREHPFAQEVRSLFKALVRGHRHICYSAPLLGDRQGDSFDASGRLDADALRRLALPSSADYFVCGPAGFMSDICASLAACGVASGRIHTETFGAAPSITPGVVRAEARQPHPPAAASDSGPMVSFVRSGLVVRCGADFHSLLDLAEACDVPTRWSCRTGVCHTCETGLIAGTVDYSPDPLTPPPPGMALICCSRPQNDVILDL